MARKLTKPIWDYLSEPRMASDIVVNIPATHSDIYSELSRMVRENLITKTPVSRTDQRKIYSRKMG